MEHIPILKIGNLLLVSIQVDLQDKLALALQDDLSKRIVATGARGVLIDISALEIVDSFIGRMLSTTASLSRVLNAETVVVGMRPAVAITLVELGLYMPGVRTALTVEHGLTLLGAEVNVAWVDGTEAAAEASVAGRPSARGAEWRTPRGDRGDRGDTAEDVGLDDGIGAKREVAGGREMTGGREVVPRGQSPTAGRDVSG
jgi:rsbT antagonist protein RsbS